MKFIIRFFSLLFLAATLFSQDVSAQYWELVTSVPTGFRNSYWLDVYFLPSNPQYGWISGYNGHVLRTQDSGKTWHGSTVPYPSGATGNLESVHFVNKDIGYASGGSRTGLYKSVDGGASWQYITPNRAGDLWGTYFLNADTGVVLGGHCGLQEFFYTDNGGFTWSRDTMALPSTALTDAILYEDGIGYASGSGYIFRTANFGKKWEIFKTTGTTVWQEEIAVKGASILVPTSGTTCQGNRFSGGMRFYDGSQWRTVDNATAMFGTFLIDNTTGWACGDNRAIYYTSDAGRLWELRNCGATGNLDDIWFINPTTGWAVGGSTDERTGNIFKYVPAKRLLSKSSVDLGTACNVIFDTTWIINKSILPTTAQASLTGDPDFKIVAPITNLITISACDSVRVITRLASSTPGVKSTTLNVIFPQFSNQLFTVGITGQIKLQKAKPVTTLITVPNAHLGRKTDFNVLFENQGIDPATIGSIGRMDGSGEIKLEPVSLPVNLPPLASGGNAVPVKFSVTPTDTGWIEARFGVLFSEPCRLDTIITVRVYGVSPIISAPKSRSFSTACAPERYDTIPVQNTGNAPLIISAANITGSSYFSFHGWADGSSAASRTIQPNETDSLVVLFKALSADPAQATLSLVNNDSTKTEGNKNPFNIELKASFLRPQVSALKEIDLGRLCVREDKDTTFFIRNTGDIDATIADISLSAVNFTINAAQKIIPAKDSVAVRIIFKPQTSGIIQDSIIVISEPCGDRTVILLKGTSIETKLTFDPPEIFKTIRTGNKVTEQITVTSTGTTSAIITGIRLDPARTDMRLVQVSSSYPVVLQPGGSLQFAVEFDASVDTTYDGRIVIETAPDCHSFFQMKFYIPSITTRLNFSKSILSFTDELCIPDSSYDTISLKNEVEYPVNITAMEVSSDNYTIVSPTTSAFELQPNEAKEIIVRYSFKNFSSSDVLKITTDEPGNSTREFPLQVQMLETIRPQMTFKNLDLGRLRLDSVASGFVEIFNSTKYTQTITGIEGSAGQTGFTISLPQLPATVMPGITLQIPVQFTAQHIDTAQIFLKIASEILCSDTSSVEVIARVPDVPYPFTISVDHYFSVPPDTLDIPVVIENSFDEANVNAITVKIRFNEELAYPLEVLSNTRQPLPFAFENDMLVVTFDRNSFANMPLGQKGELFTMRLLTMPKKPFSTEIDIDTVIVESRYRTVPVLKDGSVTVEFCGPMAGFTLLPDFGLSLTANGGNSLRCEISATGEQNITFELIDIFGNTRLIKTGDFSQGNSIVEIPTAEIPSGTYFLKAQSSTGAFERLKVTIVK
jgi:photosystem II stability/assembly factor-like uncharacterized protein